MKSVCSKYNRKMPYLLTVLCLLLQFAKTQQCEDHDAAKQKYVGFRVLSITPVSQEQQDYLTKFVQHENDAELVFWNPPIAANEHSFLQVGPSKIEKLETALKSQNITYTMVYEDLQQAINTEQLYNSVAHSQEYGMNGEEFDSTRYHKLNEINEYLKVLQKKHPQLIQTEIFGHSFENRELKVLKISEDHTASKPIIFLEGGCHAREWISPAVILFVINKLISHDPSDDENPLRKYDWHIIPVLNPDGYNYSWFADRLWRKNRRTFDDEISIIPNWHLKKCIGVDLNRNFDIGTPNTNADKCSQIYSGSAPFSEPETIALRDYLLKIQNRIKLIVAIHSYSQVWVTPYMYKIGGPPNYSQLLEVAKAASDVMEKINGNVYKYGAGSVIMYPSAGTSSDWYYTKLNVSYAYTLELPDKGKFGFLLPKSYIIPVGKEVWEGLKVIINMI